MRKMIKFISISVLFVLFLSGCANKIEPKPNKIVNDLSKLKKSPLSENTYYYIKKVLILISTIILSFQK
jgi:PBP1b-binding outer membrane lipoprotein LpoB